MTRDQVIHNYCTTTTSITEGKGKRTHTVKVTRLAHKPRSSPLLLRNEAAVISNLSNVIFTQPSTSETENWVEYIKSKGFKNLKAALQKDYKQRNLLLEKVSRLTTNRLQEFRKISKESYKKKKDITSTDVVKLVSKRDNRYASLANEVFRLDPEFADLLSTFKVINSETSKLDVTASRDSLCKYLEDLKVYEDSTEIKEEAAKASSYGIPDMEDPIPKEGKDPKEKPPLPKGEREKEETKEEKKEEPPAPTYFSKTKDLPHQEFLKELELNGFDYSFTQKGNDMITKTIKELKQAFEAPYDKMKDFCQTVGSTVAGSVKVNRETGEVTYPVAWYNELVNKFETEFGEDGKYIMNNFTDSKPNIS